MRNRLIAVTMVIVLLLFGAFTLKNAHFGKTTETFSSAILKVGSSGKDVTELQGRLKFLGYFDGKIDGQFGSGTKQAVTWFQWKFGLKSDGIVGAKTKLKLWEATKNWAPSAADNAGSTNAGGGTASGGSTSGGNASSDVTKSNNLGLSANDLKLMANAVYGESRGEPYIGQVAVAAVILNRVKSPSFPNTVSGVIFQPGAFTAVADGQIWLTPNENAKRAVQDALNGMDPTGGCIYYFNPETATSKWIWSRPQVKTIGKHIFCM
ncbi:spore cortex-lytic enzyme [Paenibacillus sacheonensis]|uniref:Spore cortex-lytic enzyme n=1 Tax=Paenibacillus sacheonensis TaxID=742054 RepID=A0A7X4YP96_9BACL|nr:spore cortex-lytic enzyme [Paenibacillus sacheonensis]MBM7564675.1 N-acetylmuramoyl-L-alanine amidase [Paenibacillus sacheonensis]NBC69231.1 spore cortex-lytic enzyme [Paenibacillus sacheonensis]